MINEANYIGKPVRSLQTMLRMIGKENGDLPTVIPDGIFGRQTEAAVRSFQAFANLPATGIVNQQTWEAVTDHYRSALVSQQQAAPLLIVLQPGQRILPGERNRHLFLIQSMLLVISAAYDNMPTPNITGIHDLASQQAVTFLKQLSNQPADPVIDKLFYALLVGIYRSVAGDGTP